MTERVKNEMDSCYNVVCHVLSQGQAQRDDDQVLIDLVDAFCVENNMPTFAHETITRSRRIVQNTDGLYPASLSVQEKRKGRTRAMAEYTKEQTDNAAYERERKERRESAMRNGIILPDEDF